MLAVVYTNGTLMQYGPSGTAAAGERHSLGQRGVHPVRSRGAAGGFYQRHRLELRRRRRPAAAERRRLGRAGLRPVRTRGGVPVSGSSSASPLSLIGQQVLDAIFTDGSLFQFDATGTHLLQHV